MSSVTVACTVRSPSARLDISSSRRRIASWLRWLWRACCSVWRLMPAADIQVNSAAASSAIASAIATSAG